MNGAALEGLLARSALGRAVGEGRITRLKLRWNEIRNPGAKALANTESLEGLTHLDLRHNRIGNAGAQALASSEPLGGLRSLELGGNDIQDKGVKALASSVHLDRLSYLGLGGNIRANDVGGASGCRAPEGQGQRGRPRRGSSPGDE